MRPENEEFRRFFELSGWSQKKVADYLHCTQPVISRWLSGKDPADKAGLELFKIILAREQPEKISPASLHDEFINAHEREILELLRGLHAEDHASVIHFIRRLPQRKRITYKTNSAHVRKSGNGPKAGSGSKPLILDPEILKLPAGSSPASEFEAPKNAPADPGRPHRVPPGSAPHKP